MIDKLAEVAPLKSVPDTLLQELPPLEEYSHR
jgi:hypothetical protein